MIFINYSSIRYIVTVPQVNLLFASFLLLEAGDLFLLSPCRIYGRQSDIIPQNHHVYSAFIRQISNGASTGHSSAET